MTADKIKSRINEMCTLFGFEYQGKAGNVDPCYNPDTGKDEFMLYYDNKEQTVYDIEAVMQTPFIRGHSINELAETLTVTDF